ncbi:Uncharacterised protein [Serratia marcescens]|uniref:Uncharacterized protein n=1 Tax=Serratia marcescens TaxID=615 RepID=A0A379ZD50_SERMA|nr:Uncharacterised protein [Serratia marcescens]
MSSAHSLSPGISFFTRNKRRMHKYGIIIAFFALCLIVALIGEYQGRPGGLEQQLFSQQ